MHVANKNLEHNGKSYAKGSHVKETDPGFKDLLQAGHLEPSDLKPDAAVKLAEGLKVSQEAHVEAEAKAEVEEKAKPKVFKKRK